MLKAYSIFEVNTKRKFFFSKITFEYARTSPNRNVDTDLRCHYNSSSHNAVIVVTRLARYKTTKLILCIIIYLLVKRKTDYIKPQCGPRDQLSCTSYDKQNHILHRETDGDK